MAQEYDKIIKENFEKITATFARKILNINPESLEEIPDDIQYTTERRPDFLKRVHGVEGSPDYILHIEVQTTDPRKMVCRMLIYYGFLYHEYDLEIEQIVLFIGDKEAPTMPINIDHKNLNFKFELMNIKDLDYQLFYNSDIPEDVILAILCDFKGEENEVMIDKILAKLKLLSKDELDMGKYCTQLEILSKLRKLDKQTIDKINTMDIFDITTDLRYLEGKEIGEAKGIEIGEAKGIEIGEVKGKKKGKLEGKEESLKCSIVGIREFNPDFSLQQIAKMLKQPQALIERLALEIDGESIKDNS